MNGPVLVTGASGLLGRQVKSHLESTNFEVIGLSHSREGADLTRLDLTDVEAVTAFLGVTRPGVIVHCAAERRPDICEGKPKQTNDLNVKACETLAKYVEDQGARMVYISTDYVFDGSSAPYEVDAEPNPLNAYGQSKLEGEKVFLERIPNNTVVLRVPILYGPVEYLGESQVTTLADLVKSGEKMKVDDWATRYPTFTPDVAQAIGEILKVWPNESSLAGIQHFSGSEAFTKYKMCLAIGKYLGYSTEALTSDLDPPPGAPRPKDSHLEDSDLLKLISVKKTLFIDSLKRVL